MKKILITSPSLTANSGMSAFVSRLIESSEYEFTHIEIGGGGNVSEKLRRTCVQFTSFIKSLPLVDIVHINACFDYSSLCRDLLLIISSKIFGRKVILHMHGGKYLNVAINIFFVNALFKAMLLFSNQLVLLSSNEVEVLSLEDCDFVKVIPNSVKNTGQKRRFWVKGKKLKIIYLGRLDARKGLCEAISAINILEKKGYAIEFHIYGEGPDKVFIQNKVSSDLHNSTTFKGNVSGKNKIIAIQAADIFLMPSYFEGLPFSLLEVMAYGVVPIVTDVGSIKDVLIDGHNGFFVKVKDIEDIVQKIELFMSVPDKVPFLSQNAFLKISSDFKLESTSKEFSNLYANL